MNEPTHELEAYFAGAATDEQLRVVEAWLHADPANAHSFMQQLHFREVMGEHLRGQAVDLRELPEFSQNDFDRALADIDRLHKAGLDQAADFDCWREQHKQEAHDLRRHARRIKALMIGGGIAALLAVAVTLIVVLSGPAQQPAGPATAEKEPAQAQPPSVVATLIGTQDAQWAAGDWSSGSTLQANQRLTLTAGLAELMTADGAVVVIQAPATIELLDRNAMYLHTGRLVGRCETPQSKGLLVHTAHAKIKDIGTIFGVESSHARLAATVFVGEIEVTVKQSEAEPQTLSADQTASLAVAKNNRPVLVVQDRVDYRLASLVQAAFPPSHRWSAYVQKLHRDPALLLHYGFDRADLYGSRVANHAPVTGLSAQSFVNGRPTGARLVQGRMGKTDTACLIQRVSHDYLKVDGWPDSAREIEDLTLAMWVRLNTNEGWHMLATQWNDGAKEGDRFAFHFGVRAGPWGKSLLSKGPQVESPRPGLQVHRSTNATTFDFDVLHEWRGKSSTTVQDGWVLATMVLRADGMMELFRNGVLVDRRAYPASRRALTGISQPLLLGSRPQISEMPPEFGMDGLLDDVVILSRAMSGAEILEMYNAGKPDADGGALN